MGVPGRKSYFEELQLARRYANLCPKVFDVLQKHLDSPEPKDNQWAVEQINKAFIKAIPQNFEGESGESVMPILVKIMRDERTGDTDTRGV